MEKRSGRAKDLRINSWRPSRMKTSMSNRPVGKNVTVFLLPAPAEPRQRT
jgi:hypothetical protein